MLGRQCLYPINCESELEIDRLLGPECPIVVEGGDAPVRRNEIGGALGSYFVDELDDRFLRAGVIPRQQWVLSVEDRRRKKQDRQEMRSFTFHVSASGRRLY
jgi:hypothetical protein